VEPVNVHPQHAENYKGIIPNNGLWLLQYELNHASVRLDGMSQPLDERGLLSFGHV
jgi:hypothetical protein